jgi:chromate reductase
MVLRQILLHAPAYVMPEPQMLIPRSHKRFDENGNLTDEETRERMHPFLTALTEWIERFKQPKAACERSTR